jgi:6,7-dimethyl-8-ribityllumazine synthase
VKEFSGKLCSAGLRVGIVVSRFNQAVTDRLLQGALDVLDRTGASGDDIQVVRVPGSFEIPLAAQRLAESKSVDALICLGTIIRGETDHYAYIAGRVTDAIASIALQYGIAVGFGVVTTDTAEQALDRAGLKHGNKGADAALAAIEMASLLKQMPLR